MEEAIILKNEIVTLAKCALIRTNLLINQCNNWLPEEEGNKNMKKQILLKQKKKKQKIFTSK